MRRLSWLRRRRDEDDALHRNVDGHPWSRLDADPAQDVADTIGRPSFGRTPRSRQRVRDAKVQAPGAPHPNRAQRRAVARDMIMRTGSGERVRRSRRELAALLKGEPLQKRASQ